MADKIIKGLLFDGNVNLIAINGTELIRDAKTRHGLSRVCTAALGRTHNGRYHKRAPKRRGTNPG